VAMAHMGCEVRVFSIKSLTETDCASLLWYIFSIFLFLSLFSFFLHVTSHIRKVEGYEFVGVSDYDPYTDRIYDALRTYNLQLTGKGNGTEWSIHANTYDELAFPGDPRGNYSTGMESAMIRNFGGVCT
jgi:hypothetical protein